MSRAGPIPPLWPVSRQYDGKRCAQPSGIPCKEHRWGAWTRESRLLEQPRHRQPGGTSWFSSCSFGQKALLCGVQIVLLRLQSNVIEIFRPIAEPACLIEICAIYHGSAI